MQNYLLTLAYDGTNYCGFQVQPNGRSVAQTFQDGLEAVLGCARCGFSVGIFWPGTFSLAALALPGAGTAMYALMALAGDLGCSAGPTTVGLFSGALGGLQSGLTVGMIFPIAMPVLCVFLKTEKKMG